MRQVRHGRRYILIKNGRPVAKIEPVESGTSRGVTPARTKLLHRLTKQRAIEIGRWTREDLYGR